MNRSASAGSRLFSMKVMRRSAGSFSSTAILASGKSAPSMISAQWISSASGAASKPNLAATVSARNLVQLLAFGS